ncbi:MAG: hypothetical protein HYS76_01875 [Candidatus Wildermuthbacteria bacterium]|nr:hypothetical protein [Candidatus Wildermuthbacteria bacterium]
MAIVFSEQKKKQRYLILVFVVVILATVTLFWFGVFKKPSETPPPPSLPLRKVEINFSVFDQPLLSELELLSDVPPFAEEVGRDNPFLPAGVLPEKKTE